MTETVFRLKRHLTSFQIMILGFAGVILLGALVLMLPIASVQRIWTPFHEALFTSTSAVCVTGLVVQDTGSYWSAFGQTVILLLIQIGGLGVITGAVTFLMLAGRNITLKERSAMQDAISAPAVGGIVRLTRFILKGTFLVELLGALALLPIFCRDYGLRGVWMSVFHSVSAFCNAGFCMVFSCCGVLAGQVGMPLCCGFPVRAKARTASKICCSSCGVTPEMLAEGTSSVLWKTNGISEQCHGTRPPSMVKS